jgi:hypothetical protein
VLGIDHDENGIFRLEAHFDADPRARVLPHG